MAIAIWWEQTPILAAGTYPNRLMTVNGCDSIVTLNLTVNPTYNEVLNEAICMGENFLFEGNIYTASGTYTNRLTTIEGCDSIITLNLTVNPTYNEVLNEVICDGDSYMVGANAYTAAGTYPNRLMTVNGCDSIVTLNLTVNPTYNEVLNEAICMGENFLFEGNIYTASGTYTNRLTTIEGCDSIITLNLTVNPTYNEVLNEVICNGDSYMVGTNVLYWKLEHILTV